MKNFYRYFVIVALFLAIPLGMEAQTQLQNGRAVNGNLARNRVPISYSYIPSADGYLIIETTGNTNTFVEVYNNQNEKIAEDDNSGQGNNAKIEIIVEARINYRIDVKGANDSDRGRFSIIVNLDSSRLQRELEQQRHLAMWQERLDQAQELRLGVEVSKNLGAGEEHWFKFQATEIGTVSFYTSGNTDTYIEMFNPQDNFKLLGENDDGGEGTNARYNINFLAADRRIIFKVRGASRSDRGTYRIIAETETMAEARRAEERRRMQERFVILPSDFNPSDYTSVDLFRATTNSRNLQRASNKLEAQLGQLQSAMLGGLAGNYYLQYVSDLTFVSQNGTDIIFSSDDNSIRQTMTIDQRSGLQARQRVRVYYEITRAPLIEWQVIAIERR